ncbi:MAG TPA: hypothetical protein VN668_15015 [Stellaceae bacterium]|nr:hypothetical protein [Stellaceae bacterium]
MLDAQHYRAHATQMRKFAAEAPNPTMREECLRLAAEYDKLADRASERQAGT